MGKHFSMVGTIKSPILKDWQIDKAIEQVLKNTKNHAKHYHDKRKKKPRK